MLCGRARKCWHYATLAFDPFQPLLEAVIGKESLIKFPDWVPVWFRFSGNDDRICFHGQTLMVVFAIIGTLHQNEQKLKAHVRSDIHMEFEQKGIPRSFTLTQCLHFLYIGAVRGVSQVPGFPVSLWVSPGFGGEIKPWICLLQPFLCWFKCFSGVRSLINYLSTCES